MQAQAFACATRTKIEDAFGEIEHEDSPGLQRANTEVALAREHKDSLIRTRTKARTPYPGRTSDGRSLEGTLKEAVSTGINACKDAS